MKYIPDNWVVIKIKGSDPHYKVLAGWSGGYAQGDSWRMNSGVTGVEDLEDRLLFYGHSGSVYSCGKKSYGLRMNNVYIWEQMKSHYKERVELMPEGIDWTTIDWIIGKD